MGNLFNGRRNIPLDAIESIANLEPLQRSEHYYTGIAWIMMEANVPAYTERAIELFHKALELKPGGWVAMEGLARCYGDNRHELETAIRWMETAMNYVPEIQDFEGIKFYLQVRIPSWGLELGNVHEAVGKAQAAYEGSCEFKYGTGYASDPAILRSIEYYTEALYKAKNYDQMMELLYEVNERETYYRDTSLWTIFLQSQYETCSDNPIFNKIGTITRALKSDALQGFMRSSIRKSINIDADSIAQDKAVWLAHQAAKWQYSYALQPEESVELWEEIVTLVDQNSDAVQQSQTYYRTSAAEFLSMIYFHVAIKSYNNGGDASAHIAKLEKLACHRQGSKQYYPASYPALILCMWLHEYAKADEKTWRACIRPSIIQALYLLSDDDPWNDQGAYDQLGEALLLAGDTLNASIALGITTKPLEEQRNSLQQSDHDTFELAPTAVELMKQSCGESTKKAVDHQIDVPSTSYSPDRQNTGLTEKEDLPVNALEDCSAQGENERTDGEIEESEDDHNKSIMSTNPRYAGFDCMWTCDGPCETPRESYAMIYFCRVCNDVCVCEKCIELLRNDEMPFRRCAKDHPFVRVYPMIEEVKRVIDALVQRRFEV